MEDRRKPLADYIAGHSSQAQFARDVGCSEPHLSQILANKRNASPKMARRILEAAGPVVPLEVLLELPEGAVR